MDDLWPMVHAERAALIADLETLDDTQWQQASLCVGWSVHDVAAHLVDTALTTPAGFMLGLARSRFDFDRQNARGVERHRAGGPRHTLARLREVAARTSSWRSLSGRSLSGRSSTSGALDSCLVEAVVHAEDIRRPLEMARVYPGEALARALRHQVGTSAAMGGARDRVAGLRLEATDSDLVLGDGALVRGSALDLLLAVSGRQSALGGLTGPGVERLGQPAA